MKLTSFTLESVLGAPDGTYSLRQADGAPAAVVHLRGPAASGKSSVLRAIAAVKEQLGAYGAPPRPSALRRRGSARGRIAATWALNDAERQVAGVDDAEVTGELLLDDEAVQPMPPPGVRRLMSTWAGPPRVGRVELVPATRALVDGAPPLPPPLDVAERLSGRADKYAALGTWIIEFALSDGERALRELDDGGLVAAWDRPDALRGLRLALQGTLPRLRLRGVSQRDGESRVIFQSSDGAELDLFELSSSEQEAVLFTVIVRRHRLDHSVLLVDEPFLVVEPARRVAFMQALSELAADLQIVVASSAPELRVAGGRILEVPLEAIARTR